MRILFYVALSLVCALVASASFIYVALPAGFARDQVVAAVRAKTGRELFIAGPVTVSFYPKASVILHDASLSLPEGMSGDPFVRMERLELEMPLLPLFNREVRIERFMLVRPRLHLMVDRKGRRSWDFASTAPIAATSDAAEVSGLRGSVVETGKTPEAEVLGAVQAPAPSAAGLEEVSLGEMLIEDGSIVYFDELSGTRQRVDRIDARVEMAGIRKPVMIDGTLEWQEEPLPFKLEVAALKDLIEHRQSPVVASVTLPNGKAGFKGMAAFTDSLELQGAVDAETSSLSALSLWLGKPVPRLTGIEAVSIKSRLAYIGRKVTLDDAAVVLNDAKIGGTLSLDVAGRKPMVRADLAVDHLDLTPFMPKRAGTGDVAAKAESAAGDEVSGLVERVNAEIGGGAKKSRDKAQITGTVYDGGDDSWSSEPMSVASLAGLNADVKVAFGSLKAGTIETGQGKLAANLKDKLLKTKLQDVAAFGGKAGAVLTVDARQKEPRLEGNVVLRRVELGEVLAVVGIADLHGQGEISMSGMSTGASPRKLIAGLLGQGRIDMGAGAVTGIDVPMMFDELQTGKLAGWRRDTNARTEFDSLSASFSITKGKLASDDLKVTGRRLTMTGAGIIDLPARTLNYGARPVLFSAATAGGAAPRGIEIPVRITGPWAAPAFAPDLERIARNVLLDPATALNTTQELLGKVPQGAKLKEVIGKLTGGAVGGDFATTVTKALGDDGSVAVAPAEGGEPAAPVAADGQPSLIQQLINQQKQQSVFAPQP